MDKSCISKRSPGIAWKMLRANHWAIHLKGELTDVSIIERARRLSKNKKSFEVDILAYRKGGQPMWISVINSVILDKKGEGG